jgi:hypothetical protein
MRKRLITEDTPKTPSLEQDWLNLEALSEVELTSEDSAHPIESALLGTDDSGWRAVSPGRQTIRVLFPQPQRLRRIWLEFMETDIERTQEYVLRWSADGGRTYREIVRQQWNFNPRDATCETEDHHVELPDVTILELSIVPNVSGGDSVASLQRLKLA